MPFEISPDFAPSTIDAPTRFKKFADAILRGCAVTAPHTRALCNESGSATCAFGAMYVGFGITDPKVLRKMEEAPLWPDMEKMRSTYWETYGREIVDDNDKYGLSRERIAARIAAL